MLSLPKLYAPQYWMAAGQLCRMKLSHWKQEEAAMQSTPDVGHRPVPGGTYASHGYTQGCHGANPNGYVLTGEHGTYNGTLKLKADVVKHITMKNWWEAQLRKRKIHQRGTNSISLRRHWELRLLLLHRWGKQYSSLCPSGSEVVSDPHHAYLKLSLQAQWRWKPLQW